MSLSATIGAQITGPYSRTKGYGTATYDLGNHPIFKSVPGLSLADGTGSGMADLYYTSDPNTGRTLAASASETIDLSGTPTTDALGDILTFAKVKVLAVYADPLNVNDVVIGGAASNTFVGPFNTAAYKQNVRPGGLYLAIAPQTGWTVTGGTGDLFQVANGAGGTSVIYHLLVIGTSV
jgi:hypothetical protein